MSTPPQPSAGAGRGAKPGRRAERTETRIAVALGGPLVFAPPVMALADRETALFGVPAIVVYLFTVWLVGIVVTALAARPSRR